MVVGPGSFTMPSPCPINLLPHSFTSGAREVLDTVLLSERRGLDVCSGGSSSMAKLSIESREDTDDRWPSDVRMAWITASS